MGHPANNLESLGKGDRGYLYFASPEALWVGNTRTEQHIEILGTTKRNRSEISIAGRILEASGMVVVSANGSLTLKFPKGDPTPVAEFIRNFPNMNRDDVLVRE